MQGSTHDAKSNIKARSYYHTFLLLSNNKWSRSQRFYHATAKREILPLIGVGVLAIVCRYSYRAAMRMKEELEEYEQDLKEYDSIHPNNNINSNQATTSTRSKDHNARTISHASPSLPILGISIGTSNTRLSFLNNNNINIAQNISTPFVIENREGSRRTPSFVLFDNDNNPYHYSWGHMAKAKRYQQQKDLIINPIAEFLSLDSSAGDESKSTVVVQAQRACQLLTKELALNALQKVLGELPTSIKKQQQQQQILFGESLYYVQPVITYPPVFDFFNNNNIENVKNLFMDAFDPLTTKSNISMQYVSEPIAAIVAANHFKLFGAAHSSENLPVLVLDIGGDGLNVSLVAAVGEQQQQQQVLYHSYTPDIGVDTLVASIVNLCVRDFFGSSFKITDDGMASQLLYNAAEDALLELSSSSPSHRAQISIPYLSMNVQTKKPRHLSMGITSHLVEEEATHLILTSMNQEHGTTTKNYATTATTVSQLISSVLVDILEKTNITPFQLRGILLCGDGARSPIYQSHIKKGLAQVAGEHFVSTKLIIPPNEQAEELVVLGAALMGRKKSDSE